MSIPRVSASSPFPVSRFPFPGFFSIDMHPRQSVNMRGLRGRVPRVGGAAAEVQQLNGEP